MPPSLAVDAKALAKRYGSQSIITALNLEVHAGEFVALVGASGCGKTTLLRICAGLESLTEGTVQVFGRSPAEACAARQIGLAFQRPALVPSRTALQNVELTLRVTRSIEGLDPKELLERFGLAHALHAFPHQLSGGMQQRVNIACAVAHQPALLLLDEPFGALDELTRERLADWLGGVLRQRQRTAILVTHSVEEAVTLADRVLVMSRKPGNLAAEIKIDLPLLRDFGVRQSDDFLRLVRLARQALHDAMGDG